MGTPKVKERLHFDKYRDRDIKPIREVGMEIENPFDSCNGNGVCFRCTQAILSRKAGDILLVWLTPKIRRGAGRMDLRLAGNDKIRNRCRTHGPEVDGQRKNQTQREAHST